MPLRIELNASSVVDISGDTGARALTDAGDAGVRARNEQKLLAILDLSAVSPQGRSGGNPDHMGPLTGSTRPSGMRSFIDRHSGIRLDFKLVIENVAFAAIVKIEVAVMQQVADGQYSCRSLPQPDDKRSVRVQHVGAHSRFAGKPISPSAAATVLTSVTKSGPVPIYLPDALPQSLAAAMRVA